MAASDVALCTHLWYPKTIYSRARPKLKNRNRHGGSTMIIIRQSYAHAVLSWMIYDWLLSCDAVRNMHIHNIEVPMLYVAVYREYMYPVQHGHDKSLAQRKIMNIIWNLHKSRFAHSTEHYSKAARARTLWIVKNKIPQQHSRLSGAQLYNLIIFILGRYIHT